MDKIQVVNHIVDKTLEVLEHLSAKLIDE